jgi:Pseudouridylate synthases, 23S RNA-specific
MMEERDIIFKDEHLIAINKPPGLLVHRTSISDEDDEFALQQVRDLIGQKIYPVHRLDRPTSGVLLFGLSSASASALHRLFLTRKIKKRYIALVRGWFKSQYLCLNYPVKNSKGNLIDARTDFRLIERFELPIPVLPYETSRYSLIEAIPTTGRWHQIRQHLAHLRNYIINDRVHGTGAHNKMFLEVFNVSHLFLHAREITFVHPFSDVTLTLKADFPPHWRQLDFLEIDDRFEK